MDLKQKEKYQNRIKKFNLVEAPIESAEDELWRPIKGYEDQFLISSKGRVFNIQENEEANIYDFDDGYSCIWLEGKRVKYVHRLVAEHFLRNPLKLPVVNHKDENKHNNDVSNLEWCTYKHNSNWGTAQERKAFSIRKYFDIHMIDPTTKENVMNFKTVSEAASFLEGDGVTEDQQIAYSRICRAIRGDEDTAYDYEWKSGLTF